MRRRYSAFLQALIGGFALLLGGAAPANNFVGSGLVGIWRNAAHARDPNVMSLTEIRSDGSFTAEFRHYENCTVSWTQRETGTWSVERNIYLVTTQKVDGKAVSFTHQYGLEAVTTRQYRARDLSTAELLVETRVDAFAFPRCFRGGV